MSTKCGTSGAADTETFVASRRPDLYQTEGDQTPPRYCEPVEKRGDAYPDVASPLVGDATVFNGLLTKRVATAAFDPAFAERALLNPRSPFVWEFALRLALASWVGVSTLIAPPQTEEPTAAEASPDHTLQLETCRAGLIDSEARPEERRRMAELLFSYRSPEATAMMAELLKPGGNADVQRALAGTIATRGHDAPDRLDAALVAPLIALLGAEGEDLRALAARALADFPGSDVPARLGALAADAGAPLPNRLAAIDALAQNTHRRDVVGHFITLLDAGVPEITDRVLAVLEPLAPQPLGKDAARWREWWAKESRLTEEAWLAERSVVYRDRLRRTEEEFQRFRNDARRDQEALTNKMRGLQREMFRALPADQRDAKLAEWLGDSLPVVKQSALTIIKARMADEGRRPDGDVLSGLLTLLRSGTPATRREVLEIVQNVGGPAVVEAVLAQLDQEKSESTRHALFKALGRLDSVDAIPAMIREIAASDSPSECVREAALSLGQVIGRTDNEEWKQQAIAALKQRIASAPADNVPLRAALLNAMAGVADPAFREVFLAAVDSEAPTILREAVRGLRALRDQSKLPRLRTLMAHAEPLVRLEAIEAVAQLGREDADLERLLMRLNPATETNDLARDAAWRGFRQFLSARPAAERVKAAEQLRDLPDLEIRYLEELAGALAASAPNASDLTTVFDRLGTALVLRGRHGEAIPYLKSLYDARLAASDPGAPDAGLRLLAATIRAGAPPATADLIRLLAQSADDAGKSKIVDVVRDYLESPAEANGGERLQSLRTELKGLPAGLLPLPWPNVLDEPPALPASPLRPSSAEPPTSDK